MLQYWIWYSELPGSLWQKRALLEEFEDPEALFYAKSLPEGLDPELKEALEARDLKPGEEILRQCRKKQIDILTFAGDAYPERLRQIPDPPVLLYYKGILPDWEANPFLGIVGTRKATSYGLQNSYHLGKQISLHGGRVISGGAAGIDSKAMEGALEADAPVVGVLGGGVDVIYPRINRRLFSAVTERGCLLSEYAPGERPLGWHFLRRNRIISGLSHGIIVVEAPARSGALSTAGHALKQGRDLFAVPGNIGVAACEGSNALLREEAGAVLCGWDALKGYAGRFPDTVREKPEITPVSEPHFSAKVAQNPVIPEKLNKIAIDNREESTYSVLDSGKPGLTEEEQAVLALLSRHPRHPDEICGQSQLPAAKVQMILTKLTLRGLAVPHPGGLVSLK